MFGSRRSWLRAQGHSTDAPESKRPLPLQFASGDGLTAARNFAATRTPAVAKWGEDVKPKPILAVSDSTGDVAKKLMEAAFRQFGSSSKAKITVVPVVQSEQAVPEVVAKSTTMGGALVAYMFSSQELEACLADQCLKNGVPCINVLESALVAMARRFGARRGSSTKSVGQEAGWNSEGLTVFAVSDSTGAVAFEMARAALQQFQGCGVDTITRCPNVRSLEEINHITVEAFATDSVVIFTFASPGMSRFMRQQCERLKVSYADVYQPTLIVMEKYLNYPPVGVPGGMDVKELDLARLKWEQQSV